MVTYRWKIILLGVVVLAVAVASCVAQPYEKLWVLASSDARRTPSADHLRDCLTQLAQEWKIPVKNLPPILIFHVSRNVAETANVREAIELRRNSVQQIPRYFEIWIVGDQPLNYYIFALQSILEHEFHLAPGDEQRKEVLTRVGRLQNAIIDVREGR